MKKRNAILGLILCTGFMFSAGFIFNSTSANAGYYITKSMSGGAQAFATGAGGAAGGYAGMKLGAKIGSFGGPVGMVLGAGLGAL